MTILRAGDRPDFHTLPAGQVLTVVPSPVGNGIIWQYPDTGCNPTSGTTMAGSATTVGPFTGSVRLGVECRSGAVDWSSGWPVSRPALALSDAKVAAVDSLLVSGAWIVNTRDGLGRATSLAVDGVVYTVTYSAFGPATISGGGIVKTINRTAGGQVTSITVA